MSWTARPKAKISACGTGMPVSKVSHMLVTLFYGWLHFPFLHDPLPYQSIIRPLKVNECFFIIITATFIQMAQNPFLPVYIYQLPHTNKEQKKQAWLQYNLYWLRNQINIRENQNQSLIIYTKQPMKQKHGENIYNNASVLFELPTTENASLMIFLLEKVPQSVTLLCNVSSHAAFVPHPL